ncbi:MAG TPA: hypothetical protein VJZ17_02185 [Nitrosopumilaceae archaeon]|nr:hypothetical protein [Nitrosopumilaceae archaeon]
MKHIAFFIMALLLANLVPVFGDYVAPTKQEQELYNKLLAEFEKLDVEKKDVSDVLKTFEEQLIVSFPCDSTDLNDLVVTVVKTRLAKFDETQVHEGGVTTGGTYTWQCTVTTSEGKITMDCDNEIRLNPVSLIQDAERDPRIKKAENLVILYHELLHGQLMIDAITSSDKWRYDVCNKPPEEKIDYSYSDKDHKIINPLQTQFILQLVEKAGGIMIVDEIKPEETHDGAFTKKMGSLHDYPEYIKSGIHVTLRASNLINTEFSSPNSDIVLSGNLSNKTQSGIAWLYIFGNPEEKSITEEKQKTESAIIPDWVKRTAGWWADDTITSSAFLKGIEYLIQERIIVVPDTARQQSSDKIPSWFKQNAAWWSEGKIDDKTFANGIQYLISVGIISV